MNISIFRTHKHQYNIGWRPTNIVVPESESSTLLISSKFVGHDPEPSPILTEILISRSITSFSVCQVGFAPALPTHSLSLCLQPNLSSSQWPVFHYRNYNGILCKSPSSLFRNLYSYNVHDWQHVCYALAADPATLSVWQIIFRRPPHIDLGKIKEKGKEYGR
jgi:hypothetical protein